MPTSRAARRRRHSQRICVTAMARCEAFEAVILVPKKLLGGRQTRRTRATADGARNNGCNTKFADDGARCEASRPQQFHCSNNTTCNPKQCAALTDHHPRTFQYVRLRAPPSRCTCGASSNQWTRAPTPAKLQSFENRCNFAEPLIRAAMRAEIAALLLTRNALATEPHWVSGERGVPACTWRRFQRLVISPSCSCGGLAISVK